MKNHDCLTLFRKFGFTALLLSACQAQTDAQFQVVKFHDAFTEYMPIENDCAWKEVDLPIFEQSNQRVSFRYNDCRRQRGISKWSVGPSESGTKILGDTVVEHEMGVEDSGLKDTYVANVVILFSPCQNLGPMSLRTI